MKRIYPLPLGEGRGEGLVVRRPKTLPLFPLPKGKGMKRIGKGEGLVVRRR